MNLSKPFIHYLFSIMIYLLLVFYDFFRNITAFYDYRNWKRHYKVPCFPYLVLCSVVNIENRMSNCFLSIFWISSTIVPSSNCLCISSTISGFFIFCQLSTQSKAISISDLIPSALLSLLYCSQNLSIFFKNLIGIFRCMSQYPSYSLSGFIF